MMASTARMTERAPFYCSGWPDWPDGQEGPVYPEGQSRSRPQRMQTWLWSGTTLLHSGQRRSGSSRSLRWRMAASVPIRGSTRPTRNQIQNELPLSLPITAADRPQKKASTTNSKGRSLGPQHAERPDGGHHGQHQHRYPGNGSDESDHDLEED